MPSLIPTSKRFFPAPESTWGLHKSVLSKQLTTSVPVYLSLLGSGVVCSTSTDPIKTQEASHRPSHFRVGEIVPTPARPGILRAPATGLRLPQTSRTAL